jgi:hypothetical protein
MIINNGKKDKKKFIRARREENARYELVLSCCSDFVGEQE